MVQRTKTAAIAEEVLPQHRNQPLHVAEIQSIGGTMRITHVRGMRITTLLDVLDSEIAMKEVWELQTTIAVGAWVPGLQHHYQQAHFQQLLYIQRLLLVL
jgi:hypothetical protein